MALNQYRITVLDAINEVRKKSKLGPVTALDQDSDSLAKLTYLNDVVTEISDYGNWPHSYDEVVVSVQSSVIDYAVSGAYVVQNIHEVAYSTRSGEMRKVDADTIRRLSRTDSVGEPTQWALKKVNTNGNPVITVHPRPDSTNVGDNFKITIYKKPPFYVTADSSAEIAFPGRLVVAGLLAKTVLDESDGEPTTRYLNVLQEYEKMLDESFNRYVGDTGSTVYFRPARGRR